MNTKEHLTQQFTALMIEKIETLKDDYSMLWISSTGFRPRNISGNYYRAGNMFLLSFLCEIKRYELPIFMTFHQAKERELRILKGEKAYPVYYYNYFYKHNRTEEKIYPQEYNQLTPEEKNEYKRYMFLKYYNVFNIDQTDFKEVYPEQYNAFIEEKNCKPKTNHFVCSEIDEMILLKNWYCPIHIIKSDEAFYRPLTDEITCPLKEQFPKGENFYSTLLHEIAHSTGHKSRLNRQFDFFGTHDYAIEELTAELTSAVVGAILNIGVKPREENAQYLKSWLSCLKEEPKYLFNILGAVSRAIDLILSKLHVEVTAEETAIEEI